MSSRSANRIRHLRMSLAVSMMALLFTGIAVSHAAGGTMMDYYLPMPIYQGLESTENWGAPGIIPRDVHNGIEDSTGKKWSYWDGTILKGSDGRYHLYCSR